MKVFYSLIVFLLIIPVIHAQNSNYYRAVGFRHDNDINFFTDQYFTSGVQIQWYSPVLKRSPVNKILLPDGSGAVSVYAITLTHHMYTPNKIFTPEIVPYDHPYAAYFLIGQLKETYNVQKKLKKTSSFQLGWIGPQTGGEVFQNTLHKHISIADRAEGWDNQIRGDPCFQYSAQFENGMLALSHLELISNLQIQLGVPRTQAMVGMQVRTGYFVPYFRGPETLGVETWQFWGFSEINLHVVNYNAVLQGGFFNKNNPYTLDNVNRTFWHLRYGAAFVFKKFGIKYAVDINSPTFTTALWHHWSEITFILAF